VRNYETWKATPASVSVEFEFEFSHEAALSFAVLEYGQRHKLWSENDLTEHQRKTVDRLLDSRGNSLELVLDAFKAKEKMWQAFVSRLAMALFGGAALIAPMLIMALHQSKLTSLLTTSLFVIAVAVMLAWWMEDATNKDIVGATAAYAAVLVVFVGTGTTTTG
jgi:VIT1/CCC1 family predicted Fe2+/Mn2+ transporter